MKRMLAAVILALLLPIAAAHAAIISAGSATISPGTASVAIPVTITGGENIAALNMTFVVGDGGPALGGTQTVKITGFTTTGGIFDSASFSTLTTYGITPPIASADTIDIAITTAGINATATGLVGMIDLDTSSLLSPTTITLTPTYTSPATTATNSSGGSLSLSFSNGTLAVVAPEPASLTLLALGALTLLRRRRD